MKKQHEEFKNKYLQKLREDRLEGEIMKAQAKLAEKEAKERDAQRKRKILLAQEETKKANDYLKLIREQEKLKEKKEEERIERYAKQRDLRIKNRQAELKRKFDEKQAIRQKLIDTALEEMTNRKNIEGALLNKQIKERRIKEDKAEEIKLKKRAKLVAAMNKHMHLCNKKKTIRKEKEKNEDKDFQAYWRDKNKAIVHDYLLIF